MNENFKCQRCAKCCKTYWITLLPSEASGIAKLLRLSPSKFIKKHCVLFLQAFPARESFSNSLIVSRRNFPKGISSRLSRRTTAQYFLCLPGIALKRERKTCVMLSESFGCRIHSERPGQCRLFPLISSSEVQDLKKAYSFCKGLKGFEKASLKDNQKHYEKVKAYFERAKEKGFKNVWKQWPSKGVLVLDKEKVCSITEKQFFQIIGA